jgi:putative sulfotransferase
LGHDTVFVVSTGRCGSTLISSILRAHPEVLSLSELFGQLYPFPFRSGSVCAGTELWTWLTDPNPLLTLLLRNGAEPEEFLYPRDGKWFDRRNGIPAIVATTLPHLTDDPDAELARLAEAVPGWGAASIAAQFDRLFALLDHDHKRPRVRVERSGASLLFLSDLVAMFPRARTIHVYRNGMDAAWSMRLHPMYRLLHRIDSLRADSTDRSMSATRGADAAGWRTLCDQLGPADIDTKPPVSWFGAFWSRMILDGLRRFSDLPPDRLMTINYEFLCAYPTETLPVLAAFLGVDPPQEWLDLSHRLVRPARRDRWRRDTADEQRRLATSCEPGMRQLRRFLRDAPPWSLPPEPSVREPHLSREVGAP